MHKEIGGYLELERFTGAMLHEGALALSSGRACLSYLIEQRGKYYQLYTGNAIANDD